MFCPSCGTDLPDQTKFCGSCGFQIPAGGVSAAPQGGAPQAPQAAHTMMMAPGSADLGDGAPNVKVADVGGASAPAVASGGPVPSVDEVIQRGVELPIGDSLGAAWDIMKAQMGIAIGGFLVVSMIGGLAANLGVGIFVLGPIYAGFDIYCLRAVNGQAPQFETFFDGFKRFVPFMILGLIRGAMIFGGSLLFILPGIYLGIATMWAWFLHIDRGIEPWEAIKTSMRIVNSNFFAHFGFLFVMGLVGGLGAMACYVGALLTMPLASLAVAWAYKKNFGIQGGAENIA